MSYTDAQTQVEIQPTAQKWHGFMPTSGIALDVRVGLEFLQRGKENMDHN